MTISPEELAAFADGELNGARAREVAAAIQHDPELARQVEQHRALKARLAAHFAPIMEEPPPEKLQALLRPRGEVVDFAQARDARDTKERVRKTGITPRWAWMGAGTALAASLVLALLMPQGDAPAGYADTELAGLLDRQLISEQPQGAPTRVLLSFRNGAGEFCRAFSAPDHGGIACRDEDGWRIETEGEGSRGADTDYRQAGTDDAAVMARAQEMAIGPALDADQEAAAKASQWRRISDVP